LQKALKVEEKINKLIEKGIEEKVFTRGAGGICIGDSLIISEKNREYFFDLASLTKVMVTFPLILRLLNEKILIDDEIGNYLPVLPPAKDIRISELLSHTSGLPSWKPFYKDTDPKNPDVEKIRERILMAVPLHKRGSRLYSDIGFMWLGFLIEALTGLSLSDAFRSFFPELSQKIFFIPVTEEVDKKKFVPTGYCSWRKRRIRGEVHDENAYALGGIAGHAGCFSTIEGVCYFCQEVLKGFRGKSGLFPLSKLEIFVKEKDGRKILLGWDYPEGETSTAGKYFSEFTIGHLGFTGTSIWIDIKREIGVVLLTNRTVYGKNNKKINPFRRLFHNELIRDII
jgi:CubicO group peptidase (beta-lactamase class C family)